MYSVGRRKRNSERNFCFCCVVFLLLLSGLFMLIVEMGKTGIPTTEQRIAGVILTIGLAISSYSISYNYKVYCRMKKRLNSYRKTYKLRAFNRDIEDDYDKVVSYVETPRVDTLKILNEAIKEVS